MDTIKEKWYQEKIKCAITVGLTYGNQEGEELKMWVIDQMMRCLVGIDKYEEAITAANTDGTKWSVGVAPKW